MAKYIIGVDEVGRGPLAGPLVVCAFCIKRNTKVVLSVRIRDSKKMSAKQREVCASELKTLKNLGRVNFSFASASHSFIDRVGLSKAVESAVRRSILGLKINPADCQIFLDGGLCAPAEFSLQKTIVRGDQKIKVISCASVLAKVRRDKLMERMARIYPEYGFEKHKGYGTKLHYSNIEKHNHSPIHRKSFLSSFLKNNL